MSDQYDDGFYDGVQSKQSEVDELQNKYDEMYRAFTVADDCRKEWCQEKLYYIRNNFL